MATTASSSPAVREEHADPIADPGLHEHQPRPTDVDEKAEKRAERQIATLFGLSALFAVLFVVSYFVFHIGENPTIIGGYGASNVALGVCLGMALLLIGIAAIQWARKLMSDVEIVEMRHPAASSDEDRADAITSLKPGHRRLRHRPASADPQLDARRARHARPADDRRCCATSVPLPATSSRTPCGTRACASSTTSPAPRSSPKRSRSAS